MHPLYRKRRLMTRLLAVLSGIVGILGLALPFLQGFLLMAIALALWSLHSTELRTLFVRLTRDNDRLARGISRVESWLASYVHLTMHTREEHQLTDTDQPELVVLEEVSADPQGVAVILHSASSVKESPVLELIAQHYRERGFTVVRFDATHGLGESGGSSEHFTAATYLNDLERVMHWIDGRPWPQTLPIAVAGHSIGGMVAAEYAATHQERVRELLLFAPTVSGVLLHEHLLQHDPEGYARWHETGSRLTRHPYRNETKPLGWGFLEEVRSRDLVSLAAQLTMPVRILVGEYDRTTLADDCRTLANAIGAKARLHILPLVRHNPVEHGELVRVRRALRLPASVS